MRKAPLALVLTTAVLAVAPATAAAQTKTIPVPPIDLASRTRPGDALVVTDRSGREITGSLARLSDSAVTLVANGVERDVALTDVGRIEKRGDSLKNGALIGAGVMAAPVLLWLGSGCDRGCGTLIGAAVFNAGLGAFVGALIDRAHEGRTSLFNREQVDRQTAGPVPSLTNLWTRTTSGNVVYVTDLRGGQVTGVFQYASAQSITLFVDGQLREIAEADIRQLARQGDSVWNGAGIGMAVGGVLGAVSGGCTQSQRQGCGSGVRVGAGIVSAAFYGLVGAGVDALVKGRTTVFVRKSGTDVHIAPLLAPHRAGVAVAVRY